MRMTKPYHIPNPEERWTGEDVAHAAAADFKSFFLPGGEVPIRVEVEGVTPPLQGDWR